MVQLSLEYLSFQSTLLDASLPKFKTGYVPKGKVDCTCRFPGEDPKEVEIEVPLLHLFLIDFFLNDSSCVFSCNSVNGGSISL